MNTQLKTILLTVLTLSVLAIAVVELSGVSRTALFNKYDIGDGAHVHHHHDKEEEDGRMEKAAAMPRTEIEFEDTRHDFGKIREGEIVKHAYRFRNTGAHPLLISRAQASCGCTVPEWPKEPIPPGGEGSIVVEFNSKNRPGIQNKNVLIYSNGQVESMSIGFSVEVEKD